MKVRDKDRGAEAYRKRLEQATKEVSNVQIGVFEDAGQYPDGTDVLDVAMVNEFGSSDGHVPQRSFIRAWFDESYRERTQKLRKYIEDVAKGRTTASYAAKILGIWARDEMKKRLEAGIPPANADATVRKKGFDHPLKGQVGLLKEAITYRIGKK